MVRIPSTPHTPEQAATDFAWPANQPNGRKFVKANSSKESINNICNNIRFEPNCEELIVPELEIRFSIDDLRIGYDKGKDDIYNFDELTKIVFRIAIFPQGKGLQSICQWEQELQSEYETHKLASGDSSEDDHDDDNNKEIYGTITLVIGKRENVASNVISAYLNGVEKRVSVDTGAAASIIHHSIDPRKDRKFKTLNVQRYYLPNRYDMNWKELEPNVTSLTGNESQYDETYWSSEDEDESKEETTSNRDEDMKINPSGEDNINESYDNNRPEERELSTELKPKNKEKEDAANEFSEEEDTKTPDIYKEGKIMHMRPLKTYLPTPRMEPRNYPPRVKKTMNQANLLAKEMN